MIGRGVASLPLDVRVNSASLDCRRLCDQRAMSTNHATGKLYAATSRIDALLAADRGVESLLGQDGELGEPRTALGVVSGRHSRMLQR